MACLDFSKAFDKLQPYIVIDKMRNYGIYSNILNMLGSFLERRKQCVKVNGTFSSYIDVWVGAPQGTKLGPLLWLFYVNGWIDEDLNVVQYADDTNIHRSFGKQAGNVASAVKKTLPWAEKNNVTLNAIKTVFMNVLINHRHKYE